MSKIQDSVRDSAKELFAKELTSEEIEQLESSIEAETVCEYSQSVVKLLENLKSEYVMENIKTGKWKLTDIVNLERETLNPKKWQDLQEARIPKQTKERRKGTNRCPKCKSWYTTHKQAQTRSADEGLTTRCHCDDCGHNWKFG